jgi:hypothetical protein
MRGLVSTLCEVQVRPESKVEVEVTVKVLVPIAFESADGRVTGFRMPSIAEIRSVIAGTPRNVVAFSAPSVKDVERAAKIDGML